MRYCKCGNPLDALHMGDIEPDMCIECEIKIINSLEIEPTNLILWEAKHD